MSLLAELYEFRVGTSFIYRTTSSNTAITYNNFVYEPSPVLRTNITQGADPLRAPITITFPKSNEFAYNYVGYSPDFSSTVTILRGEIGGSTWNVVYKGRIGESIANNNFVELSCESIYTAIQRDGLQARYEYTCRHLLYSSQCGANPTSFSAAGTVSNISGTTLTVTAASSQANGYYAGGIIRDSFNNQRYILSHTGSSLVINRAWVDLAIGTAVTITAGCDRSQTTCLNKFNNIANFGGFPWIPIKNPFEGRIN
jgi:uncharacterized phage protein (TIGR02218 family)